MLTGMDDECKSRYDLALLLNLRLCRPLCPSILSSSCKGDISFVRLCVSLSFTSTPSDPYIFASDTQAAQKGEDLGIPVAS